MPRRQILSSEEKERLLVVPDDDALLTRMCFLSEHDLALINKHRRPENRLALLFYSVICGGRGFLLSAKRKQSWQVRRRDAVGQRNAQLAVEAIGCCFHALAGLLQSCEYAGTCSISSMPARVRRVLRLA